MGEIVNYLFRFDNSFMDRDAVDSNGKVTRYKTINVVSDCEENARIKAYRPKVDVDSYKLLDEWELIKIYQLGEDWNV